MIKIKHEAMVGMDTDMCNIPENDTYDYHIMVYRKDVTGEILGATPSQPNLLITHKNSMYMSGYWDSSSSVLSWRLLNMGDGTDILTTTTTTTTPKPTRYVINGSFAFPLYNAEMVMVDPNGDERIVDVEFENPSSDFIPSYDAYVVTTTFDPSGYKLKVSGYDALLLGHRNYWAGEITLPNTVFWFYDPNTATYSLTRTFTSSILTTTTTTTVAPTTHIYRIEVANTNVSLSNLDVTVSNSQTVSGIFAGTNVGSSWIFEWEKPTYIANGWTFVFSGLSSIGSKTHTATLTNMKFVGGVCTISNLILKTSWDPGTDLPTVPTDFPTVPINPLSLDDPGDTNSLDGAINDYLNE